MIHGRLLWIPRSTVFFRACGARTGIISLAMDRISQVIPRSTGAELFQRLKSTGRRFNRTIWPFLSAMNCTGQPRRLLIGSHPRWLPRSPIRRRHPLRMTPSTDRSTGIITVYIRSMILWARGVLPRPIVRLVKLSLGFMLMPVTPERKRGPEKNRQLILAMLYVSMRQTGHGFW